MSPEEIEAAAAADAADSLAQEQNTQAELTALQAKVTDLVDQAMRAQAEAQNARRRADEEVAKVRKFAVESFAESLLAVVDSLEAALKVENASAEQLLEGTGPPPPAHERAGAQQGDRGQPGAGHQIRPHARAGHRHGPGRPGPEHHRQRAAKGLCHRRSRAAPGHGDGGRPQISFILKFRPAPTTC
jgi:hypothetical protein